MTLTITAVPLPDPVTAGRPQPSADITVSGIPFVLGQTITLWRSWDGQRAPVRGVLRQPVLGSTLIFTDWECPFGVPVSYQATVYNPAGATVATGSSAPIYLLVDQVWLSDPFSPGVSCTVALAPPSLSVKNYDSDGAAVSIQGAALPVAVVGMTREADDIPIRIQAGTDKVAAAAALTLLRNTNPFVMRVPAGYPAPPLMYLSTNRRTANTQRLNDEKTLTALTLTATMVAAPTASVVVNQRTCATVLNEASTCADLLAGWATCLDVLRG